MKWNFCLGLAVLMAASAAAIAKQPAITGDYLEVRSCDVYTGSCFANAEMGLTGKEGILVWSVRQGEWNGTRLDGLSVIAVVRTDATMGNLQYQPRFGKAVLIVDAKADASQKAALADLAKSMGGPLIHEIVDVKTSAMKLSLGNCDQSGCAQVQAGRLVQINTRCFGEKDHVCGNEETFYPPLTAVDGAYPVFTELASFQGKGLDMTWQSTGQRSAFLAKFSR